MAAAQRHHSGSSRRAGVVATSPGRGAQQDASASAGHTDQALLRMMQSPLYDRRRRGISGWVLLLRLLHSCWRRLLHRRPPGPRGAGGRQDGGK